ncbi:hypothetical protein ACET3X_001701 [Alternaria dauci]|uniref:C3H1-type domain-containing protein n=1 Tax=Alternaria dauci TaxID=48095 RepID=A0ABR3UZQ9_9PLEO
MTTPTDSTKQGAELQRLGAEGRALQKDLAIVSSNLDAYLKKYTDTSERTYADSVEAQKASMVAVAETSSNNAIVLVLIDGTSHEFHDELYRNKQSGGAETAKRLLSVVREKVAGMLLAVAQGRYQIVIKIFACLKTLSSRAAARKLAIQSPRSLAFHFAQFNKISPFFDFVDVGDEGFVATKISENLKQYLANEQCKHVFFCAARSPKYHSALKSYRGQTKRVTIVASSVTDNMIRTFGLCVVSFVRVFKASPMYHVPNSSAIAAPATGAINTSSASSASREASIPTLSSLLPTRARHGRVPINLAKQRLDLQTQVPTPAELQAYKDRTKLQGLCIDFHLRGQCFMKDCKFSHGTMLPGVYCVLQYKALGTPCFQGSGCRNLNCAYAHICQKEECARAGRNPALCELPEAMHKVDPFVADWVAADGGAAQSSVPVQSDVLPVAAAHMEDLISFE